MAMMKALKRFDAIKTIQSTSQSINLLIRNGEVKPLKLKSKEIKCLEKGTMQKHASCTLMPLNVAQSHNQPSVPFCTTTEQLLN